MKFSHQMKYDAPPADVHAMLADPTFREKVATAGGAFEHDVRISPNGDGMSVVVDQKQHDHGIPSFAKKVVGEWPAYRVSTTHVMTMQHRLLDCYWQMRMPELELGSDVSVALIAYLTKNAEGGEISAPGLKR